MPPGAEPRPNDYCPFNGEYLENMGYVRQSILQLSYGGGPFHRRSTLIKGM